MFDKLIDYVRDEGGQVQIEIRLTKPNYRSVFATQHIKKDQVILFVPDHLIINWDVVTSTKLGKKMVESKIDYGKHGTIMFYCAYMLQHLQ